MKQVWTFHSCLVRASYSRYRVGNTATWDTPLPPQSPGYSAFLSAFEAYLWGRTVLVPMLKPLEAQKRDSRVLNGFVRMANQPSCVTGGVSLGITWLDKHFTDLWRPCHSPQQLMDFQVCFIPLIDHSHIG